MKLKFLAVMVMLVLAIALVGCTKEVPARQPAASTPSAPAAPAADATAPAAADTTTEDTTAAADEMDDETEDTTTKKSLVEGTGDVTEKMEELSVETSIPVDVTMDADQFDEVGCKEVDGKKMISVKVTNSGSETWELYGKEYPKGKVRITNRGITDITPGCDSDTIAAGESVVCTTIDVGVVEGDNRISIQTPAGTEAKVVNCP
jgi:hypothetical protein